MVRAGASHIIRCFGQPAWPSTWRPVVLFVLVRPISVVAWPGLSPLQVLTVCGVCSDGGGR